MKHKRRDIEIAWTDGLSNQHSIGNVFDLIMDNVRDMIGKREITKAQIRQHVDLSMDGGSEQYRTNHAYAIVEATLLALGWTIVDDDQETVKKEECADLCSRMTSFAEGADKLRELFKDVENLAGQTRAMRNGSDWQPIETAPKCERVIVLLENDWRTIAEHRNFNDHYMWVADNGKLMVMQPVKWMPIPPLPENKK